MSLLLVVVAEVVDWRTVIHLPRINSGLVHETCVCVQPC